MSKILGVILQAPLEVLLGNVPNLGLGCRGTGRTTPWQRHRGVSSRWGWNWLTFQALPTWKSVHRLSLLSPEAPWGSPHWSSVSWCGGCICEAHLQLTLCHSSVHCGHCGGWQQRSHVQQTPWGGGGSWWWVLFLPVPVQRQFPVWLI